MIVRLLIVLWLFLSYFIGQTQTNDHVPLSFRKKRPWIGNNAFLERVLQYVDYDSCKQVLFEIPVQFWVYTSKAGESKVHIQDLEETIGNLNRFFAINKTLIRFYALPEINYVRKNKHRIIRWDGEAFFITGRYKNEKAINIHIVEKIVTKQFWWFGPTTGTFQGLYNSATDGIVLAHDAPESSVAHEVGHFFGLEHTHRNAHKGKRKQEAVNRNLTQAWRRKQAKSCEIRGDYLCGTPADPELSQFTNSQCQFADIAPTDAWGEKYAPDFNNLMAYPKFRTCRQHLVRQQIAVVLYSVLRRREKGKLSIKQP